MSDYIITMDDELYHYGVKGMRWGVRRNTTRLNSGDSKKREKAVAALEKHRDKGAAEIGKLKKKGVKLEKAHEKNVIRNETKAADYNRRAAKLRLRAFYASKSKAQDYLSNAQLLEAKARTCVEMMNQSKAKITQNEAMIRAFEREISNIDVALADNDKKHSKD